MLYFVFQTLFLSLLVFTVGLFIGVFLKNSFCKQLNTNGAASHDVPRQDRRWSIAANHIDVGSRNEETRVNKGSSLYKVKPNESAAIAKKRTLALIRQQRN